MNQQLTHNTNENLKSDVHESWADIENFEGFYQLSDQGRIRSVTRYVEHPRHGKQLVNGRILRHGKDGGGYHFVYLCKNGKPKMKKVARLVAFAFVPNPDPVKYYDVNHDNGNKDDNSAPNLNWTDDSGNQKHAFKTGLNKALVGVHSPSSKSVKQINTDGSVIKIFPSLSDASREIGVDVSAISACAKKRKHSNTAGGYKWEYA